MSKSRSESAARRRLMASAAHRALLAAPTVLAVGISLAAGSAQAGTVNPVQNTTYDLTPANNPITFGSGTNITTTSTPGVDGPQPTQWYVTNQGQIQSSSSDGVVLETQSTLVNAGLISGDENGVHVFGGTGAITNSGTITGVTLNGVYLQAGGSVTNNAGGAIDLTVGTPNVQRWGVNIQGADASVTNAGSITSNSMGVLASSVTNQTGGYIGARYDAVEVTNGGSITNSGTISTTGNVAAIGVVLDHGGTATNNDGGQITGFNYGVVAIGYQGAVTNAGQIASLNVGNGAAVDLGNGGTLDNQDGGSLVGNTGVYGQHTIGSTNTTAVTNAGTITGLADPGVHLFVGGSVSNASTGQIAGADYGVLVEGGSGEVTNAGAITGGGSGVDLEAGGAVTNNVGGLIQGGAGAYNAGVYIAGGAGAVSNDGAVTGDSGVVLLGGGTLTNTSSITSSGAYGVGVLVSGGAGTVTNSGSIAANGAYGFGVVLTHGGTIDNQAGGSITGADVGVYARGRSADVTNAGSITGTTAAGVVLVSGGSVTNEAGGTITGGDGFGVYIGGGSASVANAGSISGAYAGVYLRTKTGTVTNSGSIIASGLASVGVYLRGGGSVTNQAGGVISAYGAGVVISGAGAVANYGTIQGGSAGVALGVGQVANYAGGTITGGQFGVLTLGPSTVTNAGVIKGTAGNYGVGVLMTNGGTLSNQAGGAISGAGVGVYATYTATITNAGSITGTAGNGVTALYGSTVENQAGGTISGANFGVYVAGGATVTNAGTITGGVDSIVFAGAGANTLTLQTGSQLSGDVVGSTDAAATNALILQGAGEADNAFLNFNSLTVQGPDAWTLGGTSTIGTTEVSSGTLIVTGALTSAFAIDAGGTLQGGSSNLLAQGTVADDGALVFDQAGAGTFANNIDGAGGIVLEGGGALTLSGVSSVATTEVSSGTLIVSGSLTSAFSIDTGGTLQGSTSTLTALGDITDNGALVLDQTSNGSLANNVVGTGSLTLTGGGTLTLSGALQLGSVDVSTGELIVTGTLDSAISIDNGAMLQGGSANLAGSIVDNGALIFDQTSDGTYAGPITGTGSMTITGGSALTLSGASSVATTEVAAGSLIVTGSLTSAFTIDAGATLQGGATNLLAQGTLTDDGTLVFDQASAGTFGNAIDGSGAIVLQGGGTLTLSGVSSVATTEVSSGTLIVTGALTSAFSIDAGGTLQGGASNLLAQGTVTDNGTLVFDQVAAGTFGNAVDGSGGIILQGGGALTLSGTSNVATTEVAAGSLIVAGSLTSAFTIDAGGTLQGSSSTLLAQGTVIDNGALVFDQAAAGTFANAIDGSGGIVLQGGGTLTLSGTSNVSTTEVSSGTLIVTGSLTSAFSIDAGGTLQGNTSTLTALGDITDNGALVLDQTSNDTLANNVVGTGSLTLTGGGTLTLSGASQLGSVDVSIGELIVTGSLDSAISIDNGATLQGGSANLAGSIVDNGALVFDQTSDGTYAGPITGTGSMTVTGGSALTLSGASSVATTEVAAGSLIVTGSLASAFTIDTGATLQGSSSTLLAQGAVTDDGTLVFNQPSNGTFANAIDGSGGVVLEGGGTLTLSGTSIVATTEVSSGTLIVTGALTSAFAIDAGGTLQGGSSNLLAQGTVADDGALVFDQAGAGTFANNIDGGGGIVLEGGGALTLSGTSNVSTTEVSSGTLIVTGSLASAFSIDAGGTLQGSTSTLNALGDIADNGALVLDQTSNGALANNVVGTGSLTLTGGGTLTLSGASQLGSVDVSAGELIVTGSLDSAISIDAGATLQGGSANLAGSVVDNGALIFDQASDGTYAGPITGTGSMTVTGGSALTLSGTSNVATTEVAAGALIVTGSLTSAFSIDAGGTLQGGSSNLLAQGTVADDGALVFDQAGAGTFANNIDGGGGIVLEGGGALTLSGTSNVSTTEVSSGTLIVTGSLTSAFSIDTGGTLQGSTSTLTALGDIADNGALVLDQTSNGALANNVVGTGSLTLTGGGTLTLSGASQLGSVDVSTGELIVTGTLDSAISIDNGATLQGGSANLAGSIVDNGALIFSQTSDGTYAGPITGTGSMTVTGGSALTLSGTSNVATTEVAAGSLTVTGSLASAFTVDAGGTLQGSTSTLSAQGTVADNGTLVFDQAAAGTFANAIEGSGAIVLQGGGTLTLSGASNVSTTEVSSGTLIVSGSLTSAFAIDAGATLQGGASNLLGAVTDNGMLVFDQVNAGTFAGAIDGSGAILLKGGGALTLSGASNVATTEVSAGALIVTGSLTSAFTIDTGATLQGGSVNLLAQGAVADNGTLIFNQTSAGTFANAIDGSGAIVLDGGAALTLSSASQVATTTVDNGALIVTGSLVSAFAIGQHGVLQGSAASLLAQGAVADNGELVFDQAGAGTFANVIDGSGAVVLEGGGALTLSGTSSVAATLVDNGALIVTGSLASAFTIGQHGVLQGAVSTLLAQGPIVDNGSLVLDQVGDGALLNAVVGSGGLTVTGGGALTLSGASSVGSTEVAAGSLIVTGFLGSAFTIDKGATLRGGSSNLQGAVTDNGALVFDQTNTGTFGGAINGSGAIVVEGGGVLGLSGTSSVATTTVEAGALVVTGSLASAFIIDKGAMLQGGSANLHGAVTDNGVLVFDQLSDGTFAGAINGSGVIGLDGGAALTLSGASQVATTVVDNGALIVTGSLASAFAINPHGVLRGSVATLLAQGPIADDGSLVLDQASDATLSTSVVGSGGLTLTGGGALTLSGVSQLGSVDVSAGTLIVSGQLVGAFTIDAGGTLEGSTANLLAQGAVTDNGSLVFTQGSNAIFANDIDGVGAITKQGGGLLVLNGVSQVAQTTVAAGNLQVGDFAHASAMLTSNVTVNSGATLSGHGTVVGEVINNGVVSPGGTIGVLTIKGDFTQGAGGTLALEIGPSGSSELEISGKATLAGALQLDQDPGGIRKGQVFDLLTAGSISGAFGQVDSSGNVKFDVSTIGDTLVAVAENGNFAIQGGTPNQRSIAIAFNNFPAGVSDFDPLATSIINLSPGAEQDAALNQLGSEIGPDLMSASRDSVRALLGSLGDQLQERTAAAGGGGSNDPVWLGGFGRFGSASSDGDAHGFRSSAGGLSGGVQLDFGADTTLGAAVSYDNTTLTLNGLAQRGSVADTSAGLYGEQRWGGLYADLGGVWGYDHASEHRSIVTPGVSRVASASFSGSSGGVQATFGDRIATSGGWTIAPRAGVSWSEVSQGGYVETGAGGADLAVAASHQDAVQSLLGVRVSRTFAVTGGTLGAQASFDWAHDFDTLTPVAAESFAAAAGTGFSISGVNPGRDAGLAHLGLVYQASRVSVFARYEGSFSRQQNQNAVEAGVKVAF